MSGNATGTSRPGDRTCRRCDELGHFIRDCPQPRPDGAAGGVNPGPVTYIPPEVPEEELFQEGIRCGEQFERYYDLPCHVEGTAPPVPINTFTDANLHQRVYENVKKSEYKKPTPIQKYAIPAILAKRDVLGCAQTGSGKTAAFLLPILSTMLNRGDTRSANSSNVQEPRAVILEPTRELAIQTFNEARKFSQGTVARPVILYGGVSVQYHLAQLREGASILVATVGRMVQFLNEGHVSLRCCQNLVLDEADRMLDMGFEAEIRHIVQMAEMPGKGVRQTLMFSATFPEEIQQLAKDFLAADYLMISVGAIGSANPDIRQSLELVAGRDKKQRMKEILLEDLHNSPPDSTQHYDLKTLVFVERKRNADYLATKLSLEKVPSTSIHGDRDQKQREDALRDFKTGVCPILIATDVAARGLDIPRVDHVLNYDLPQCIEDYVHRIGRTGRVGNLGRATAFYDSSCDRCLAPELLRIFRDAQQEVPDWLEREMGLAQQNAAQFELTHGKRENGWGGGDERGWGGTPKDDAWNT